MLLNVPIPLAVTNEVRHESGELVKTEFYVFMIICTTNTIKLKYKRETF